MAPWGTPVSFREQSIKIGVALVNQTQINQQKIEENKKMLIARMQPNSQN